jgi:hypothetical protein
MSHTTRVGGFISIFVLVLVLVLDLGILSSRLAARGRHVEAGILACQLAQFPAACFFRRSGNTKMRLL